MSTSRTITVKAADIKAGMTLGELAAAVQQAMRDDTAPEATVKATVTFSGRLKTITIATEQP